MFRYQQEFVAVKTRFCFLVFAVVCAWGHPSDAGDSPASRVLVIGIDGTRADALKAAKTPAIDRLIQDGAFSDGTKILGQRYRGNNTVSGPGWSSFLTGVWADKHGVDDNSFEGRNYEAFPHLFNRVKSQFPGATTASFVDWEPIDQYIVSDADVQKVYPAEGADDYAEKDETITVDACQYLSESDPHAVVVYLGAIDETGHHNGFHPSVPAYISAIEKVDTQIGRLVDAVRSRPNYQSENWLVVISTDHGGRGVSHGDGHDVPEINTTFLVVSGQAARKGAIKEQTYVVDVTATALSHLGVRIKPEWKLDGRPVGLENVSSSKAVP
ncbi:alkaline phosphatase family protein [Stieleria sp. JC731]|uniref:alkaline phosphatase family protein n=1 Tax=Pirellulaceae TaxID=2691357 RepID=UPI001E36B030|nr:alkaline phosphatase family protein [Stieleria sp. JC731]MCC9599163.1 alkaline phosphatase family protein [Stieleria sp. JC731]